MEIKEYYLRIKDLICMMFIEGFVEFVIFCEYFLEFMFLFFGYFVFKIGVICIDDKIL